MIYEVTSLTDEELQHLYIKESTHLQTAIERNTTYNFVQSLKVTVTHLDNELKKRQQSVVTQSPVFYHEIRA